MEWDLGHRIIAGDDAAFRVTGVITYCNTVPRTTCSNL